MTSLISFEPVPADYPNHLANPQPERLPLPSSRRLLLFLVVLCIVPRVAIALRIPCIAGDGVNYVAAAKAFESHHYRDALLEGGANIYPIILASLHSIGLDWETAAALWGIAAASLVVLPLWGWVRRQFDDRTALVACLLYIIHPKFILECPELMRDPTFWLFFMLAIYWMWRAVTEVHLGYFIAAGAAITLASLTRVEGLFLLVPLGLWTFWRWRALATVRGKLLVGAALSVAAFPLLLLLINLVWLPDSENWALIRTRPFARAYAWLEAIFHAGSTETVATTKSTEGVGRMLWRFFPTMARGLSPVFALLMLGGLWQWRRLWARRDNQPLFYATLLILGGTWIQIWAEAYLHNINARYALPIVLMASPWAALALQALAIRLARLLEHFSGKARPRFALIVVAVVVVLPTVVNVVHNNQTQYSLRQTIRAVGEWASQRPSPTTAVIAPWDVVGGVCYYTGGGLAHRYRYDDKDNFIIKIVRVCPSDIVLLRPSGRLTAERCQTLADRIERLGFQRIPADNVPGAIEPWCILVRTNRCESARRPTRNQ